jgi:chromosomal replication initiator protein
MDLWLGQVNCLGLNEGRLRLKVPNRFTRDWISERYLASILEEMKGAVPEDVEVEFTLESVSADAAMRPPEPPLPARAGCTTAPRAAVNPRFTFEGFVEGPTNQLALSACKAVASQSERSISPVFVCGPSGVGKTHLLNAVYNRMRGQSRRGPVFYMSAEAFMNDFVESLSSGRMQAFRERYRRECGMLLIDDIQFIVTRDRTQEEFFHVFNELYNTGRPIVISSDRPPREIGKIEQRLRSRFEWGLIADIRPPDEETRIAITLKKATEMDLAIPRAVTDFIAENARDSVREIEGALIRLDVQSSLSSRPISLEMAREALGIMAAPRSRKISAEDVIRHVASSYGVKVSDLKGARRHRSVARPRQVAMFICRDMLHLSYPEIGERFGGRDHTTVMNACRKITSLISQDSELRSNVDVLRSRLDTEGC